MAFSPGFDFEEAKQCLALCADVETNTPTAAGAEAQAAYASHLESEAAPPAWPLPVPGIKDDWDIVVDPPSSIGLDNYWRLYKSKHHSDRYAAAVRGTIAAPESVLADIMLGMLKAQGSLRIDGSGAVPGFDFAFKLADDPDAGVHHGFTYGLGALMNPAWEYAIAKQVNQAIAAGATELFITGHSQGAAIATLLRSYLHYQPPDGDVAVKTYVFAQPKPGNDYMAADFDRLFATPALAYRVTNSLDWVPQVGFTIELPSDINEPNPLSVLPHLLVEALEKVVRKIMDWIRSRTQRHDKLRGSARADMMLAVGEDLISFNYVGMANPIALRGDPQIGAEHANDMFAQHHLGTYWALMKKQLQS